MLTDSPLLDRLWVRVLPHVNDTLLLLAAIGLSVVQQQYPFVHGWVTAKVLGLLAYIGFGMFALRRGQQQNGARRLLAGLAGQLRLHGLGGADAGIRADSSPGCDGC